VGTLAKGSESSRADGPGKTAAAERRRGGLPLLRVDSGDAILVLDAGMRAQSWNHRFEGLVDRTASEIRGHFCWELVGATSRTGDLVCHERCTLVRDALDGVPPPVCKMVVGNPGRRRLVSASTLAVSCGEDALVVHVFQEESDLDGPSEVQEISLTPRQREMLQALAAGLSTRQIAGQLTLSELTIRNHISSLLTALGCHTRLEAVAKAHRLRLIEPAP